MDRGRVIAARFEILSEAGSGGMGTIYRALDRTSGAAVALKVQKTQRGRERFLREAEVLRQFNDPTVVGYIDHGLIDPDPEAGVDHAVPYLAMRWLEGEDLAVRLQRGSLTQEDTLLLAERLATGLAVLHRAGFVHRDLKPGNIFLVDGDVRQATLLDFGVSRALSDELCLTNTGIIVGTASYMAPEVARSDPGVNASADVYSLGCVLFECLAQRTPFVGDHPVAVLAKTLVDSPPALSTLVTDVSPALEDLIARMLSKDPTGRPQDAAEFLPEIGAIATVELAGPPSLSLTAREQRVMCVLLTGIAVLPNGDDAAQAFQRMSQIVHAPAAPSVATLLPLINGSFIATFPESASPADTAADAVRCALSIAESYPDLKIALATGRGVMDATVPLGSVIDSAVSLLQTSVDHARVLMDSTTRGLLDTRFDIRQSGGLPRLLEKGPFGSNRMLLGKPTTCVGRERELAVLRSTLTEVEAEPVARAVLITAPAGVGKSRLTSEFTGDPLVWSRPGGVLFGRATGGGPFALAGQIVRRAAGLEESEGVRGRQFLASYFRSRFNAEGATAIADFLGEIAFPNTQAGFDSPALLAARRDATLMQDAIQIAWTDWFDATSKRGTSLLVLEDVHWADWPSLRLVDVALRHLHDRPLMVVANARPEVHERFPKLWSERGVQELRLGMVTKKASERLARDVLGGQHAESTIHAVASRAGGHPFFLEELIRMIAEGSDPHDLPDSVLGMLQTRFDAIGPKARHVMRAASVFGERFKPEGVLRLLGRGFGAPVLTSTLNQLADSEIIERQGPLSNRSDPEYSFRHALMRDAAYAMLTQEDLQIGHARAAAWLEENDAADPLTIAEHFEKGLKPTRAAPWLQRAAAQALNGTDLARVIELAERAERSDPGAAGVGALALLRSEAYYWAGDLAECASLAERAVESSPDGTAPWFTAVGLALTCAGQKGDNAGVKVWLTRCAETAPALNAIDTQVLTVARGVCQLIWAHRSASVAGAIARLEEISAEGSCLDPYAVGYLHRISGELKFVAGHLDAAFDELRRAIDSFEASGAHRMVVHLRLTRAALMAAAGDAKKSEIEMQMAVFHAERLGSPYLVAYARLTHGLQLVLRGDTSGAIALLTSGVEGVAGSGRLAFLGHFYASVAFRAQGQAQSALHHARRASSLPVVAYLRATALGQLALCHLDHRDLKTAATAGAEAATLIAAESEFDLFAGYAELGAAEAFLANGRIEDAKSQLRSGKQRIEAFADLRRSDAGKLQYLARPYPNHEIMTLASTWGLHSNHRLTQPL